MILIGQRGRSNKNQKDSTEIIQLTGKVTFWVFSRKAKVKAEGTQRRKVYNDSQSFKKTRTVRPLQYVSKGNKEIITACKIVEGV